MALTVREALRKSVEEALSLLGESTMQSLIWLLDRKGISLTSDTFDIKRFEQVLRELIGDGADVMMEEIYTRFNKKCNIDIEPSSNLSALERIQKILESEKVG
jgi:hypothetical protein